MFEASKSRSYLQHLICTLQTCRDVCACDAQSRTINRIIYIIYIHLLHTQARHTKRKQRQLLLGRRRMPAQTFLLASTVLVSMTSTSTYRWSRGVSVQGNEQDCCVAAKCYQHFINLLGDDFVSSCSLPLWLPPRLIEGTGECLHQEGTIV